MATAFTNTKDQSLRNNALEGLFIGTAVGDALGLAREGLPAPRATKLFAHKLQHSFLVLPFMGRWGVCSDDTDHLLLTACALSKSYTHNSSPKGLRADLFAKHLSYELRKWFLCLPVGIGMATLRSSMKLALGFSYTSSGVFSAGNGPAMRTPIIGAFFADDFDAMASAIKISTQITHTDPKAYEGSLIIALAASLTVQIKTHKSKIANQSNLADLFFERAFQLIQGQELREKLERGKTCLARQDDLKAYANAIAISKKGVSGYINQTAPIVIYTWLKYFTDYTQAMTELIALGAIQIQRLLLQGAYWVCQWTHKEYLKHGKTGLLTFPHRYRV